MIKKRLTDSESCFIDVKTKDILENYFFDLKTVYGKKKYHSYFQLSICDGPDGSNVYVKNLHDYDIQISSINQIVTEFKLYQWQGIDKTIVPDVPRTKVFDT